MAVKIKSAPQYIGQQDFNSLTDNSVNCVTFIYLFIYYHFTALYNMHYYEITIISLSVLSQC